MSIRHVAFDCDTPGCWAYCQVSARHVDSAFAIAAEKYEWSQRDGKHFCGPCSRVPACCRCNPATCRADDTGDHCATAGCAYCLNGCPATDKPCCKEAPSA